MYESFYGLRERPFSIQPDPDFLFMSQRHAQAYSMLEYSLMSRAGFTVVCGEIGCGKTTLIRRLLRGLGEDIRVGLVTNTHQEMGNLLEWIMLSFDLPFEGKSQVGLYDAFQRFLISEYAQRRRVVLIVDEAQNLSVSALEALRMLSNINADKDQLLQMILVGQPQLRDLLKRPELVQFAQRIAVDYFIPPLGTVEVADYIEHRLKVAGRERTLFTPLAMAKIAKVAQGIPRNINTLCDMVLVYAYSHEARVIDVHIVDEVLQDRGLFGVLGSPSMGEITDSPPLRD
ncbi:MAG: AAA family ATPase [Hydrogenophaga sp.]|nr:AAA family ATPase [Hydrogenophaga sp.]